MHHGIFREASSSRIDEECRCGACCRIQRCDAATNAAFGTSAYTHSGGSYSSSKTMWRTMALCADGDGRTTRWMKNGGNMLTKAAYRNVGEVRGKSMGDCRSVDA